MKKTKPFHLNTYYKSYASFFYWIKCVDSFIFIGISSISKTA